MILKERGEGWQGLVCLVRVDLSSCSKAYNSTTMERSVKRVSTAFRAPTTTSINLDLKIFTVLVQTVYILTISKLYYTTNRSCKKKRSEKIEIKTQTNKYKRVMSYLELSAASFSSSSSLKGDGEKQGKGGQRRRIRTPVDDPHAHQMN